MPTFIVVSNSHCQRWKVHSLKMSFLDPPLVVWNYLQSLWPGWANLRKLHRPHFNFITLHYLYLITLTIVGSGVLYGARNIAYIDALFFGSGAATQSGLNTVDINLLKLYQQIWIMIIPSITNPIFINSFLVFVRLYWFEKRFQNVVHEARLKRAHTTLRSRTKSEMKQEQDLERQERGVNGRKIQMMPDSRKGNVEMDDVAPNEKSKLDPQIESSSGSGSTASNSPMQEAEEGSTTAETHFGLPRGCVLCSRQSCHASLHSQIRLNPQHVKRLMNPIVCLNNEVRNSTSHS